MQSTTNTRIAVDLAKSVFEVAVSHRPGVVAERHRLSRARFSRFLALASINTGVIVVIWIVEAVAVCLDTVSLHCGFRYTRRFTAAASLRPEPMLHRL